MVSVLGVDELGRDPHAVAAAADTALQHRARPQRVADGPHVEVRPAEPEGGGAGHDPEVGAPGQAVQELLG